MRLDLGGWVLRRACAWRESVAVRGRSLGARARSRAARVLRDLSERLSNEPPAVASSSPETMPSCPLAGTPGPGELNSAVGPRTAAAVEIMAEVLARSGYRHLRADVPGSAPPELVHGTVRSHRPSLAALGGGRPVLLDVFMPGETAPEEQLSRWQLFSSAADQLSGEFHVVVPAALEELPGREWVRRLSEVTGLRVTKVWEL